MAKSSSLSLSVIIVCVVVIDIHCILHCFVLSILSWHLCTHPPLAPWIFWSTGKTKGGPAVCAAVIHCWFVDCLFPADRWLTCHQDHHRLTLSPRSPLGIIATHIPRPPELLEHLGGKAKGRTVAIDCWLLIKYFSSRSTQLLIVMSPQPPSPTQPVWYSIPATKYIEPVGTPIDGDHMKG